MKPKIKGKDLLQKLFEKNEQKCTDLFGTEIWNGRLHDCSRNPMRVYCDYFKFAAEVLKIYKAEVYEQNGMKYIVPCKPSELSDQEQQDVQEMLEAIIEIIHYAKYKRSRKHE